MRQKTKWNITKDTVLKQICHNENQIFYLGCPFSEVTCQWEDNSEIKNYSRYLPNLKIMIDILVTIKLWPTVTYWYPEVNKHTTIHDKNTDLMGTFITLLHKHITVKYGSFISRESTTYMQSVHILCDQIFYYTYNKRNNADTRHIHSIGQTQTASILISVACTSKTLYFF